MQAARSELQWEMQSLMAGRLLAGMRRQAFMQAEYAFEQSSAAAVAANPATNTAAIDSDTLLRIVVRLPRPSGRGK
jgi:hypothetical protein